MKPVAIDAFTFCDEADALEIRLNLLDQVVEHFVAVEANVTFRGEPRTPQLAGLLNGRLAQWADRFTCLTCDGLPGENAWAREAYQRDELRNAILGVGLLWHEGQLELDPEMPPDSGLVLVSDVDEIPDPAKLAEAAADVRSLPVSFAMQMHYFRLNIRTPWRSVFLPVLTTIGRVREFGTQWIRNHGGKTVVDQGGWEWSWLGSAQDNVRKLRSFAHDEYDTPDARDPVFFEEALAEMRDPFGRFALEPVVLSEGNGYPVWLVENADRYSHLVWGTV